MNISSKNLFLKNPQILLATFDELQGTIHYFENW